MIVLKSDIKNVNEGVHKKSLHYFPLNSSFSLLYPHSQETTRFKKNSKPQFCLHTQLNIFMLFIPVTKAHCLWNGRRFHIKVLESDSYIFFDYYFSTDQALTVQRSEVIKIQTLLASAKIESEQGTCQILQLQLLICFFQTGLTKAVYLKDGKYDFQDVPVFRKCIINSVIINVISTLLIFTSQ